MKIESGGGWAVVIVSRPSSVAVSGGAFERRFLPKPSASCTLAFRSSWLSPTTRFTVAMPRYAPLLSTSSRTLTGSSPAIRN